MNNGFNGVMDELRKANQTIDRIQKQINEVNVTLIKLRTLLLFTPLLALSITFIVSLFL